MQVVSRSAMRSGMAGERYTFDTNILLYSIDRADLEKHARAKRLIGQADVLRVPVLLQTLGELSNAMSKRQPAMLAQTERLVHLLAELFEVVPTAFGDLSDALLVHREHKLPFWDAVLWAVARRAGCSVFLSEDLQDGRILGGVTFRNPFRMSEDDLQALLS
jgi:predicted nucleic acid-binding protein